ncbi:hypothetical protein FCM35_KLT02134 [Carex littledalei]|uniref:Uncharacterized protein n=1 Tax=Carex littledalei TaxID=544730 RepID=A0A833R6H5_9POAL|nr:hypothetical protein FCM35_KLT02134 [Carex littledalei]
MKLTGKLENTSYGTYIEKAEGYLHQYSEPGATKETTEAEKVKTAVPALEDGGAKEPEKKEEESSGGVESYVKMAEGLVNKENKEGGDSKPADESGGGFGGALKMAGGLFK